MGLIGIHKNMEVTIGEKGCKYGKVGIVLLCPFCAKEIDIPDIYWDMGAYWDMDDFLSSMTIQKIQTRHLYQCPQCGCIIPPSSKG